MWPKIGVKITEQAPVTSSVAENAARLHPISSVIGFRNTPKLRIGIEPVPTISPTA